MGQKVIFPVGDQGEWAPNADEPYQASTNDGDTVVVNFELKTTKGNVGIAKRRNYICGSCLAAPLPPPFCPQNELEDEEGWELDPTGEHCFKYGN